MTQLILNIENVELLSSLKKILGAIESVSIAQPEKAKRKSGLDEALEDVKARRVYHADSVDDMFKQILGK
ncbi:MAG: response regulator [Bacteroidales bacterium]|nr:response regulator [Bacteroidales bacterium]